MKSKVYLLLSLALVLLLSLNACKSKESAYKAAYEAAKAREATEMEVEDTTASATNTSVPSTAATSATVQKEKVTTVDGAGIQQFSVVIGIFLNKTNATSLKDRMTNKGYQAFLAQNARGMYRVIVATFGDKSSAVSERNNFKNKFYPDFQDTWILDNQ